MAQGNGIHTTASSHHNNATWYWRQGMIGGKEWREGGTRGAAGEDILSYLMDSTLAL